MKQSNEKSEQPLTPDPNVPDVQRSAVPPATLPSPNFVQQPSSSGLMFFQKLKAQFPEVRIHPSAKLAGWLHHHKFSLAISLNVANQVGRLLMLGTESSEKLSIVPSDFKYCGTLVVSNDAQSFCMGDKGKIQCFENSLQKEKKHNGYDAYFLPAQTRYTGAVGLHDAAFDKDGNILFISTSLSFVGTLDKKCQVIVVWHPRELGVENTIGELQLTGLALRDGKPRYVTAIKKEQHAVFIDTGIVIDLQNNTIIAKGLSHPYSPKWHNNKLWLLNAGTKELLTVDTENATSTRILIYQGEVKSLRFYDSMAILAVNETTQRNIPQCSIHWIDLAGSKPSVEHSLALQGLKGEAIQLADITPLPEIQRPCLIGMHDQRRLVELNLNTKPLACFYSNDDRKEDKSKDQEIQSSHDSNQTSTQPTSTDLIAA